MSQTPKGHHRRGYLPHRDFGDGLQAITFREADSLPVRVVNRWRLELASQLMSHDPEVASKAETELRKRVSRYEDAGHGTCSLRSPEIATIVEEQLIAGHPDCYHLLAWCIMPNHVHVMIRQGPVSSLGMIVQNWKGGSAIRINRRLRRSGRFWARDYFDRAIRDGEHFWNAVSYIHRNPVKAGLVSRPEDWLFSSLGYGWPIPE